MQKLLFFLPLAIALDVSAQTVSSSIDSVTVYTSGATITRIAQVRLNAGENQLSFAGLPADIDVRRFQLEAAGQGIAVGQVRFDAVQTSQAYDDQVRALQGQIDAQQLKVKALEDATATAQLKLKFLDGIAQGYAKEAWVGSAQGQANVDSWRNALTVLAEGSAEAQAAIRANEPALRDAKAELSRLQRSMDDLRGARLQELVVTATVASASATDATLQLRYLVPQASWRPHYVARLDSDAGRLQLLQEAVVEQTTDEDWRDVRLTLSTSAPSGELVPPVLGSEFVDIYVPPPPLARQLADKARATSLTMESVALEEQAFAGAPPAPEIGRFAVSYPVAGRVTVANNADETQTFGLTRHEYQPRLITQLVPRFSQQAFLTAQFTYDADLPLQGQAMAVYVDGTYVGETAMPTALPGAALTLPMGQDRRVELKVEDQGGSSGEGGFIGRRKEELTSVIYEVTNRRNGETVVEVLDRYPVAVNEDIEVSVPNTATPPTEKNLKDQPGIILWRKTLAPGATWRIEHQFEVSYPADKQISRRG